MESYINVLYKKIKIRPTVYSDESEILMNRIFQKISEGKTEWFSKKGQIGFDSIPLSEALSGRHFPQIPAEIRGEIGAKFGYAYSTKFSIGERHIEIFISSSTKISNGVLRTYLQKLYIWFYIACGFAAVKHCSKVLKLYIYMTGQTKVFPENGVLGIPHVNAGFTYSCAPSNEIHVYRREEWFKVVIHETFHSLHLDFSSMNDAISNNIIYDMIPIRLDLRLYETYTDCWGDIIHTCFIAGGSFIRFKKMIEIERCFAIYQCARVLHHYRLSYRDLLQGSLSYKEESPIMSYYIIKSCFHFFLDDFLHWCSITNRGSLQFRHTEGTVKSYCGLYRGLYRNESYMTCLDYILQMIRKGVPTVMNNTLRRTILE